MTKNKTLLLIVLIAVAVIGLIANYIYENSGADALTLSTAPADSTNYNPSPANLPTELAKFNSYFQSSMEYTFKSSISSGVTATANPPAFSALITPAYAQTDADVDTLVQQYVNSLGTGSVVAAENLTSNWKNLCYRSSKAYVEVKAGNTWKKSVKSGGIGIKLIDNVLGKSKTRYLMQLNSSASGSHNRAGNLKTTATTTTWLDTIDKTTPRYWDPIIPEDKRIPAETIKFASPAESGIYNYVEFEVVKDAAGQFKISSLGTTQGNASFASSKGYSTVAVGSKQFSDIVTYANSSFDLTKCKEAWSL